MVELRKNVGQLILRARSAETVASSVEWLLDEVASFAGPGRGLADGVFVQVGWSLLQLRQDGGELAVCEPDFDGNPLRDFRDDVTRTLTVLARQNLLHKHLGIERTPVRYDDKVVFAKGSLFERRVYAQRQQPREGDSGWYVGRVDDGNGPPGRDDLEARYLFQLLDSRPRLLDIAALPEGYIVVFDGETIEAVLDQDDNLVWGGDP